MDNRDIFAELMKGVPAMKNHREGKLTVRTCKVEAAPLPKVDSKFRTGAPGSRPFLGR